MALDRYAVFTASKRRGWSIRESKYNLYQVAKQTFGVGVGENVRRQHFGTIYDNLRGWWRIGRNGSLLSPSEVFDLLMTDECEACSRSSSISVATLPNTSSQTAIVNCLRRVRGLKKLKSEYPVMAVSKFLHFFNPNLFVIWDREVILGKVYRVFRDDWDAAYKDIKVETDDKMMRFYPAYLLWAARAIAEGGCQLIEDFATWFAKTAEAPDCRQEMTSYYATAFEFIVIGATLLEQGKAKPCSQAARV